MARAFRAATRGYTADLNSHERRLISGLCADVITLLEGRGADLAEQQSGSDGSDHPSHPAHQNRSEAQAHPDQQVTSSQHQDPDDAEDSVFAHFRAELAGLGDINDGDTPGLTPPEDAVLARLLPEGSTDAEQAAQFRRLAEGSLRDSKIADLRTARMLLEGTPLRLTDEQAPIFGRALNDIRLTLSVRLGIEDQDDAARVHEMATKSQVKTTETFMAEIYTFVTWLQETLFSAMLDVIGGDA